MKTKPSRVSAWSLLLGIGAALASQPALAAEGEHTIDLGPTSARAITFDNHLTHDPAWSPDGRWIAYVSDAEGPDGVRRERLWIGPAAGDGPHRRLTFGHDGDEDFADYYPAWSPDGKWLSFTSGRGGATHIWVIPSAGGEPRRVTGAPLGVTPSMASSRWSPDGRSLAFPAIADGDDAEIYIVPVSGGERTRVTFDATRNDFPDWSADGTQLAYGTARGGNRAIWIASLDGSAPPRLLETGLPEGTSQLLPRYSPDGRWIAFQARLLGDRQDAFATTWVVPAAGGRAVQVTPAARMSGFVPAWSPDGHQLAVTGYAAPDVYLAVLHLDRGTVSRLASATVQVPAWSPSGDRLAYVTSHGELAVVSSYGGEPQVVVPSGPAPRGPSWSPDGEGIAFAMVTGDGGSCNLFTLRLPGGTPEPVTIGRQWVWMTAWSSSGEDIAFSGADERDEPPDVWIVSAYGGRPRRLTTGRAQKSRPMWLGGGQRLAYSEQHSPGSNARWDVMALNPWGDEPAVRLLQPPPPFVAGATDPAGRRAVLASSGAGAFLLHVLDLPDGEPRSLGVRGMAPVFSPDGQRLAYIAGEVEGLNIWTIDVRPLLGGVGDPQL
ncbi:MAG: hypothetical protein ABIL09_11400 [Gemmatimonadota bacterium]